MRRYRPAIDPSGITRSAPAPKGISGRLIYTIAWRPTAPWAIASGLMAAAAMLTFSKVSPFLYFQF
jgi:hypothetical protein